MNSMKYKPNPFEGRVRIDRYSSIRKLARAMRRGLLPEDRAFTIKMAEDNAEMRRRFKWEEND
jgi:hypothetical protein